MSAQNTSLPDIGLMSCTGLASTQALSRIEVVQLVGKLTGPRDIFCVFYAGLGEPCYRKKRRILWVMVIVACGESYLVGRMYTSAE
jgi:hypothetical protein